MDNINQSISVLYCFNAPDGDKGRLEKIKLRKSINQLRMMAGLAGVELELYVMSLEKGDAPDRCKWIDASYVDNLCRKYFKFALIRPYSRIWELISYT